ncbi:type 1 glutamine amidotransferase [Pelagicoccus sp. SDUM812003]|uniref:type 1 glutamine amidotransferase n=1 Tax=Pelagicoccus sp. SDUM812003 TaxID=3041267 RepID=UPI00280DE293|nr:type 1 glutamine amidotransferase [Pelagicoccus sp. SDUM812003]MDQ8205266.1 type 1 glutamine amidotransferase [Pelagicoccus sp. SDUM812003]
MVNLLVIDPLELTLRDAAGKDVWTSKSCYLNQFRGIDSLRIELVGGADPDLCEKALAADGVVLGGSEASAWEDTGFNDHLLDLIAICRNSQIPLLGVCYGAQLLGRALGGHVARHPDGMELGAPPIRITAKGKEHFLFKGIASGCLWAIETHSDAVLTLPPDCELLASNAHTPVQAFSFRGLLTGVQFHPEMTASDLRYLWQAFMQQGIVSEVTEQQSRILEATECEALPIVFRNFVQRVKVNSFVV